MSEQEKNASQEEKTGLPEVDQVGKNSVANEGVDKRQAEKKLDKDQDDSPKENKKEPSSEQVSNVDPKPTPKGPQPSVTGKSKPAATPRPRSKPKEEKEPLPPSPEEPILNQYVKIIREKIGNEAVEEFFINRANDHLPTLIIKKEAWEQVAKLARDHPDFSFNYMQSCSGVDYETHMEVVIHLCSLRRRKRVCFRVRTDRDRAKVPSLSHIWEAANWNEREIYDLLGIQFENHPKLERILMPDHWVGHPLRKDYVPLDKEV
ncbi:NADH-quinone oxidoreductase subunit C [Thermoflavimicrobium daqui]|uniref:NAD(P)H dehydrogenase subunit J n=1 Tax=Thermoflavimicrobium daqui TaxID=2137476 RepID=A0A364K5E4_9BACL|nr:NADH-quinone oxidoreductase subunit C [Thermoflavimicrobium daqui]RAL24600.1 NADH-quinone oxidoreductase subunit C [Thermoflavimicrobium daqui]